MPFAMLINQIVRKCRVCGVEFATPSRNAKRCPRYRQLRLTHAAIIDEAARSPARQPLMAA
jgi:hypothetical protein